MTRLQGPATDYPGAPDQAGDGSAKYSRKPWSTPRVILSEVGRYTVKPNGPEANYPSVSS